MDDVARLIEQITEEINALSKKREPRLPGDIDLQQLATAWGATDSTARRKMKLCGKFKERTGFQCLMVYDPDIKHEILVLRRYVPPA